MKDAQSRPGRDYRLVRQDGGWAVEVTDRGAAPWVEAGFGSQTEAYAWIMHDRRKQSPQ